VAVTVLASLLSSCQGAATAPAAPAIPVPATSSPIAQVGQAPVALDGVIGEREYPSTRAYGSYEVFWRTEGVDIFIGLRVKTTGWVAIGMGNGMNNSDLILCAVRDGRASVTDQFGQGFSHREDTALGGSADITVFAGSEKDGVTTFEFRRALNTGDKYDVALIKGTNFIVWSYGMVDDLASQHTARGRGEIVIG
jgi:hypothetical protein